MGQTWSTLWYWLDGFARAQLPDPPPNPILQPNTRFHPSCQKHDACYDTCNKIKLECDNEFQKNMEAKYDRYKEAGPKCVQMCYVAAERYH